jgi:hypothetical protein
MQARIETMNSEIPQLENELFKAEDREKTQIAEIGNLKEQFLH